MDAQQAALARRGGAIGASIEENKTGSSLNISTAQAATFAAQTNEEGWALGLASRRSLATSVQGFVRGNPETEMQVK